MQKNNLVFKTIYLLFGRKSFEIMSKSHLKKKEMIVLQNIYIFN